MRKIISWFLTGLATLLPVVVSFYIFIGIFNFLDNLLAPVIQVSLGEDIPGLGFLLTSVIIILVGLVSQNFLGKKILLWWEGLLIRIPLLGKVYGTVKRIVKAFFASEKKSFRQVVLVEFPRQGMYSLGFITNDSFPYLEKECFTIFVPTTPNPTSGFFVVVPKDQVILLDISVERGFEMIMSAGMVNK
ncbi:MAG: DUF502 domain-containing protein [Syntrophomonadaceae bacterium]|jgi:uncharacterized membrane protein